MTQDQLDKIILFAKSFYEKADQFHDARHAKRTADYALALAKHYPQTDLLLLAAACYLHDIGRINTDEGHPQESARLAKPFLREIGLPEEEQQAILHAVRSHGIEDIQNAQNIEAKLLFDADKIQQLSVYGFLRMTMYMVAMQRMDMEEAIEKRWQIIQKIFPDYMQTPEAKAIVAIEVQQVEKIVNTVRVEAKGKLLV